MAVYLALGGVLKELRRSPLPRSPADREAFRGAFAPRHLEAWLQIADSGPVTISDLAERMRVSLATISQVVSELDEMRVIQRAVDETDRRRVFLFVTPAHRALLQATIDHRLVPVQRALNRLKGPDGTAFIRGLQLLGGELHSAGPGPVTEARDAS